MGTSTSSRGPGLSVPIVPPWVDGPAPPPGAPSPPDPAIAPLGRFRPARRALGRFGGGGRVEDFHRGLGHYVRSGMGGADNAAARMGGSARRAGALYSILQDLSAGDLLVSENGFISQNVPLTPLRTGAHSTRTTHPFVLRTLQSVLEDAGLRVRILNPYEHVTTGKMLAGCEDQQLLGDLVWDSTSCGRYSRTGYLHCGRCVPCQVRRPAVIAWGAGDATTNGYKFDPLGQADRRHAGFDDVRSVAMAIDVVRRRGIDDFIGGAMNAVHLGDVTAYRDVVRRGIEELAMLHEREGVT